MFKVNYRFSGYWKEDHGQPVYGVSINPHIQSSSESTVFFATVGYNRLEGEGSRREDRVHSGFIA